MVRRRGRGRRGMSTLEVVLVTAVSLPVVIGLFALGRRACMILFFVIRGVVDWPHL